MKNKLVITLLLCAIPFTTYAQQIYQLNVKKSKVFWDTKKTVGGHYGSLLFNSGSLNYSQAGEPESGAFSFNMNTMRSADHARAEDNQHIDKEL